MMVMASYLPKNTMSTSMMNYKNILFKCLLVALWTLGILQFSWAMEHPQGVPQPSQLDDLAIFTPLPK